MRILVISNMYPRPHHPAGGIFVHEQVKALRNNGVDVRVVSGSPHWLATRRPLNAVQQILWLIRYNREPIWTQYDGVPVAYFPYPVGAFLPVFMHPYSYAKFLCLWINKIRQVFPFQVIHAHTAFLDGVAAAAVKHRFNVPVVLTEHTGPFSIVTETAGKRLATERGLNAADRVLAVSQALEREILRRVRLEKPERLSVMPNGVDTGFFTPAVQGEEGEWNWALNGLRPDLFEPWARAVLEEMISLIEQGKGDRLPLLMKTALNVARSAGAAPEQGAADFLRLRLLGVGGAAFPDWARAILSEAYAPARSGNAQAVEGILTSAADRNQSPGAGCDRIRMLWVGHLVEVKRLDRLLRAFAIAHRHDPRLRLTLIGSGEQEHQVKAWIAQHGIGSLVEMLPTLSRAGVREHMRHADFLVVSSETETFGVVVIEALSVGTPVLSMRCGGPEDVLSDPRLGMLVDNNAESLAIGMGAMAHRLAEFDAATIRDHAVRTYDYSILAHRLKGIYEGLLDGAPSAEAVTGS